MISPKQSFVLFYGWFVVAAAFVITFVGFGSAYTFSSFLQPLQEEFGASRGSVSLVFSLAGGETRGRASTGSKTAAALGRAATIFHSTWPGISAFCI